MKGILVPATTTYCDTDVNFYIQLKKKDVHVLRKFPISIDVLDEFVVKAIPPEVGESNHILVQPSMDGEQSDEAVLYVAVNNLIIPSPIVGMNHDDCNTGEFNVVDAAHDSNKRSIVGSIVAQYFVNRTITQSVHVPGSDNFSGAVVVADFTPTTMHVNNIFDNKKLLQYHRHHDVMSKHYQFKVKKSTTTLLHVRYDDVHTCFIEIVQRHHRQAKSWMIGECVKAKYLDPTNTSYRPRKIMRDMHDEFGVSFNYLRAWRGKEAALTSLRGDDAKSYKVLPAWDEMIKKKNPTSDIHIETDSKKSLKYFYMCLAASKQGWPHCRPVIVVDGSALKATFVGMLLAACGHDTMTPYFHSLLVSFPRRPMNRGNASIVHPYADFGICIQHLAANLKTRYKDFNGPFKTYFDGASKAYLVSEHQRHMESIRNRNPDMHRYLLQADHKK
ncbi:hypothetical protein TIFTF001_029982 [Ficus carica]|uniref:Uncharacterized protein n=1 Tax=Ficus carica TaxID=3494 RepID=A0AA88DSK4_FICCA|nr:hypothetical protein TIFTF001_029982 [Ficus carica]